MCGAFATKGFHEVQGLPALQFGRAVTEKIDRDGLACDVLGHVDRQAEVEDVVVQINEAGRGTKSEPTRPQILTEYQRRVNLHIVNPILPENHAVPVIAVLHPPPPRLGIVRRAR